MKVGHPTQRLHLPPQLPPAPKLPIDWAKTLQFPIDGNDIYGDCMLAAAEHGDNTFSGNTGTESNFNEDLTVQYYLALSGGNNGLNSGQIISAWESGLPGVGAAKIMDALDIDTTNAQLVQAAIWLFGGVFFTLKIPDNWYKNFVTGGIWDAPATADGNNGHGVWWNGVNTQGDGNLVLYGPDNQALWASGTSGHANVFDVIMQADGNLVVYDGQNQPLWASNTNGKPGAALIAQNDGNVVIYDTGNHPVWSTNTVVPAEPAAPTQVGRLLAGQGLMAGRSIKSADGRFTLIMQGDGNLVLYGPGNQALWASNTNDHGNVWDVIMQTDGNLVIYDGHNHAIWASNTNGKPGASLTAQDDGNVVIYDTSNHPLWATNTEIGVEILKG